MISTTPFNAETDTRPANDNDLLIDELDHGRGDGAGHDDRRPAGGLSGRVLFLGAVAAAFMVLAGAVTWYLTSAIEVELSIDGSSQPIDTRADTVADLLADQNIVVTAEDLVEPALDTELVEGETVTVHYARALTVTIDGVETVHTTTELTLGDALAAIDAPVEGSALSAPLTGVLPRNGAAIEIVTPKTITVDDGGQSRSLTTTARTVDEVLADQAITLSDTDTVSPAGTTVVTGSTVISITRIRVETETRTEPIAHETVERNNAELTVGKRKVATAGVDGEKEVTYSVTYTNGEVTDEEAVSSTVTKEPVTEVVSVGTKPAPAPAAAPVSAPAAADTGAAASSGGLNWAALAECESSGNPSAVNPAGYYGLYQFSLRTWASVGGSGNPTDASVAEQTKRAQILYDRAGAGQWPHCGKYLFS